MTEARISPADLAAWKAQQEANRAAREKALYSAVELWRRQQQALAALAALRPRSQERPAGAQGPLASKDGAR
jgi:hypothetical protein